LRKAECGPELLKIDQPAGWYDNDVIFGVAEDDNRFRNLPRGQVLGYGDFACRKCLGVDAQGVLGVIRIEETTQSLT
jgi:hypothetical protein